MSSPVLAALANARAQEQAAEERTLTVEVMKRLGMPPPKGDLSRWSTWQSWCDQRGIASLPAVPASIAVFILSNAALGDRLQDVIGSISAVHQAEGKADPTLSPIVIEALNQVLPPMEAPRSWKADQKAKWRLLNRDLQKFLVEHERKIVDGVRRALIKRSSASQSKEAVL